MTADIYVCTDFTRRSSKSLTKGPTNGWWPSVRQHIFVAESIVIRSSGFFSGVDTTPEIASVMLPNVDSSTRCKVNHCACSCSGMRRVAVPGAGAVSVSAPMIDSARVGH